MTQNPPEDARSGAQWIAWMALLVAGGIVAGWFAMRYLPDRASDEAKAEDVERFYVGVAALDVEANERAVEVFQQLSQNLPEEPAVWANLAIARLRLNESAAAIDALAKAEQLAPANDQIALLQALVDERVGEFDRAIRRIEQLRNPDATALYQLALLVERTGDEAATRQRLDLLHRILQQQPQNAVAQFQRARLAARLEDAEQLDDALQVLAKRRGEWSQLAVQQFESARKAADSGRFSEAARFLTFLENLSKVSPDYQDGLLALGVTGGSLGAPLREFLYIPAPTAAVAEADMGLTFQAAPALPDGARPEVFLAAPLSDDGSSTLLSVAAGQLLVGTTARLPFPQGEPTRSAGAHSVLPVDLNADLRQDLALIGSGGLAIFLQDEQGHFTPRTPREGEHATFQQPGDGVWALDYEADGDLDLLVARRDGSSQLLRNNGDLSFTPSEALHALPAPRELRWIDLDNDGDVDIAALDRNGRLWVLWNRRAGAFSEPTPLELESTAVAFAIGDLDWDGRFDVVALDQAGVIQRFSYDRDRDAWTRSELTRWPNAPDLRESFATGQTSLEMADLDNNGAVDLTASAGPNTTIWLNGTQTSLQRLERSLSLFVTSVTDVDGDGQLDLVGLGSSGAQVARGRGTRGYHWQILLPRANLNVADQRINSFGLGGRIEVRAGKLLQVAPIDAPVVHLGLGQNRSAAVARVVWPNGTVQAEFDLRVDQAVTATQRLKGSCPFVFVRGPGGWTFVKDFIWRSPLGLKINSQDTAGVNQTEDWIKIPGELLSPHGGVYEVRITAELWETHFFDHISLRVVDHPDTVEAWVDERFVAARSPALEVIAATPARNLNRVVDESGRDVADELRAVDGEYLDSFKLGKFQGLAEEHWVEFELDDNAPADQPLLVIGSGWVYPTDSSLNVAISQGELGRPHGLILEVPGSDGSWRAVSDDLGFPAGKHKTVVIPLPAELLQERQRRFRLRTNLEVYWDYLGWAVAVRDGETKIRRSDVRRAELRYRGFSELSPLDRRKPDIPRYDRLSGHGQRWRDLEGYYTHFGDVRELLETVDDRYVIMNAGDEIVLQFAAADPPPPGWKRDFVLIGDGWVKDGDYNTTHSRTVHPLPTHGDADYSAPAGPLSDDPAFQEHRNDWWRFHSRYVAPRHFERGLWPPRGNSTSRDAR